MIEINEKNNYLEIIDSRDLSNLKTAYYPKKDTTINVFYLDKPTPNEPTGEIGEPIGGEIGEPIGGEIGEPIIGGEIGEPIGGGIGEPIEVAPQPIRIGNIEIKRTGGTTVIDKNSFVNLQVSIDGRVSDFSECLDYLTLNTAI